jgi:hypothetical protein
MKVATNATNLEGMTRARAKYLQAQKRIDDLLQWFIRSAIQLDDAVREKAKLKLAAQAKANSKPKELFIGAGATRRMASKAYYGLMAEMALCRVVDNYLCYIVDLLTVLFRSRPECLKSSEQITLEFVLTHKTQTQLIRAIADRQVNRLSYQGMRDLNEFTSKRLGLMLFNDEAQLSKAIELIEMRNVIVHARGSVNKTFLDRVRNAANELGQHLSYSFADVIDYSQFLSASVKDVENRAHEKFGFGLPIRASAATG